MFSATQQTTAAAWSLFAAPAAENKQIKIEIVINTLVITQRRSNRSPGNVQYAL